ncbi:hypothetical protein ACF0H5_018798 [Mactra antiquata]
MGNLTYGLNCYVCQTNDINKCNITTCSAGETCIGFGGSGSIIGKRQLSCHLCCSTDLCNRALCENVASQRCEDDEKEDCSKLNSLIQICNDVKHARLICPRYCNLCHIVDGEWSSWSTWSSCSVTCSNGTKTRTRQCNNPAPSPQGEQCPGSFKETSTCSRKACPVHGGWTAWSPWGTCSVTCDIGMQRRDRSCSNPYPSADGIFCPGDSRDDRVCLTNGCTDGNWSLWSSWSSCSVTCGYGLKSRHRQCDNPKPSVLGTSCIGSSEDENICFENKCEVDVIFRARDMENESPANNETLVFTNVMQNVGNGYNQSTGVFTAPVGGTYLFTFDFCSDARQISYYAIVCEDVDQFLGYGYDNNYAACTSGDATLVLKSGQRVWIRSNSYGHFYHDNLRWNVFSGVLIHQ